MDLDQILSSLPKQLDTRLVVGYETNDDAGVYLLSKNEALVQTVDFFTPIVDDPFQFGQISAANSLSDVYAMGGVPLTALAIVGFPRSGRDFKILERILAGGMDKMSEAQCTVVGGHSIGDDEIKFGYAVTGLINPNKVIRNVGAQVGDVLILTKPLGTGVISTAIKNEAVDEGIIQETVRWMTQLNRDASQIACSSEVHAMTDVTGFGLLGHARAMAEGSRVSFQFDSTRIPSIPGAMDCIRKKMIPGGLLNNKKFLEPKVDFSSAVFEEVKTLLFDPQTSGGLLLASPPRVADLLVQRMRQKDIAAEAIGNVITPQTKPLWVK